MTSALVLQLLQSPLASVRINDVPVAFSQCVALIVKDAALAVKNAYEACDALVKSFAAVVFER